MEPANKSPISMLQEFVTKKGFRPPIYQITIEADGTHQNRFDYSVTVAGITATGTGFSKRDGKQHAAKNALRKLQENGIYDPALGNLAEKTSKAAPHHIVDLQNIASINGIPSPTFKEVSSDGPGHSKEFTFDCELASLSCRATASSKKLAKQLAAKNMIEKIKDILPSLAMEEPTNAEMRNKVENAISKYQELAQLPAAKPDLNIDEIDHTLAELMVVKNLTYKDFIQDLKIHTEESLIKILDKLDVKYKLVQFQESPILVSLKVQIDTPLTVWGGGDNLQVAKNDALEQLFDVLDGMLSMEL